MRLDFRILWFENQPDDVKTQREEICDYLLEVGFIPHIDMRPNGLEIEQLGRQQELYDEFDLVVVDYDLGTPGKNGDWVAKQTRRHFGFTDIIFYSGKRPADLRELVFASGIDGVYCFSRPNLADSLSVHITQVMRRISRLEAMRGLAMGIVGKCDDEFKEALLSAYENSSDDDKGLLEHELAEIVNASREAGQRQYDKCNSFAERIQSRMVTSFTLYKLCMGYLKKVESCSQQRKILGEYNEKVLDKRNMLAHAIERRTDEGWVVESSAKPAITTADFPTLRKDMARHFDNIREIASLVGVAVEP